MANERLHIICGNCGCNDNFEWQHQQGLVANGEKISDEDTWVWCRNCSTLHSLNDNADNVDKS